MINIEMDSKEEIQKLHALFVEVGRLKHDRMMERAQWRKDGKGIQFENICSLNKGIMAKEEEIKTLRKRINRAKIDIPSKYNFTYFLILEDV
jgi:hypothetical protein